MTYLIANIDTAKHQKGNGMESNASCTTAKSGAPNVAASTKTMRKVVSLWVRGIGYAVFLGFAARVASTTIKTKTNIMSKSNGNLLQFPLTKAIPALAPCRSRMGVATMSNIVFCIGLHY